MRSVEGRIPSIRAASSDLEPEQIDQDHRGSLARREAGESTDRRIALVDLSDLVVGGDELHRALRDSQRPPVAPTEAVHRRPVQVAVRVRHLRDSVPALEQPDERVLRQVLGFVPVPGHETERPVELILLGLEERLELDGRGDGDVSLGSHSAEPGDLAHRRINPRGPRVSPRAAIFPRRGARVPDAFGLPQHPFEHRPQRPPRSRSGARRRRDPRVAPELSYPIRQGVSADSPTARTEAWRSHSCPRTTAIHAWKRQRESDPLDLSLSGRGSPASRRQTVNSEGPRGARSIGGPG